MAQAQQPDGNNTGLASPRVSAHEQALLKDEALQHALAQFRMLQASPYLASIRGSAGHEQAQQQQEGLEEMMLQLQHAREQARRFISSRANAGAASDLCDEEMEGVDE